MTIKIRHLVLAVTSLACLVTVGASDRTVDHSPAHNYRLQPSMLAEYAADSGDRFPAQYGLTVLNGIAALRSELDELEEPPPDPQWPQPMARNAIYFGGTDCGRFIPESLVRNDGVRPDIRVITQNALADDSYLEILRSRLAGRCWMPQKDDSAEAFNVYVSEVQSGKRQANGDLRIENGRVQVTGALAVMEINGILAKMIFDHNKEAHDIYLEESYVIPWMYDYLSPHGLVMKLNAEEVGTFNESDLTADREFWDWQTRRLLDEPQYRRLRAERWRIYEQEEARGAKNYEHRVACRAYSKLRCATAGLYARKRYAREAAAAFREAYMLDPQSPEAAFRYIQEILLMRGKWDTIIDILDYADLMDPSNKRTEAFRKPARIASNASRALNTILCNHGSERMPEILSKPLPENVVKELTREEADSVCDARLDYAEAIMGSGVSVFVDGFSVEYAVKRALKETEGKRSHSFNRIWRAAMILHRLANLDSARLSARCAEEALAFLEANNFEVQDKAVDIFAHAYQTFSNASQLPEDQKKVLVKEMKVKCFAAIKKAIQFPESQTFEKMTHYASTLLTLGQKRLAESFILQRALKLKNAKTSTASLIEASRVLTKTNLDNNRGLIELYFMIDIRRNIKRKNYTKQDTEAYGELMKELGNVPNASQGQTGQIPSSNR